MKLIAGLGNPGEKYRSTRHNIGFQVIDQLSRETNTSLRGRRFLSRNSRTELDGEKIILLKPTTFMNRSGESVRRCSDYYKIVLDDILIIHDDLDLPVGRVKVVRHGGAGGHKGVQSIIDSFGSNQFNRIKIGIGRPKYDELTEDYVLSSFYKDQKEVMKEVINISVHACRLFIKKGIQTAMNRINCRDFTGKE